MKPLIKWPGGKERVIKHIEPYFPIEFNNYIEPFFGGGAVYFYLEPEGYSFLNDININLITFYSLIQENNEEFRKILLEIGNIWDNFDTYLNIENKLLDIYYRFKNNYITGKEAQQETNKVILANANFIHNFSIFENHEQIFFRSLIDSIFNKFMSLKNKLHQKFEENKLVDLEEEIIEQIRTAKRAGFYYFMRNLLNKLSINNNTELYIAIYTFVREFCFGSMFRYNKYGEFNIPYGGKAYNRKSFTRKVNYFFNPELLNLLQRAKISNLDFREFFNQIEINKRDFLFIDPPYISIFKDYEQNTFTERDHIELANILKNINTQYLLIIQYNEIVERIYGNLNTNRVIINSKYSYSARGRNRNEVDYIVFYNYDNIRKNQNERVEYLQYNLL